MTAAMDRHELAQRVYRTSHITGTFTLRSGQTSTEYFDKYLFESEPELLGEVADHMSKLIPADTEVLAGLEMGGIPIATALSLRTGLPVAFVKKKAKNYGTMKLAEGTNVRDRQVCIVEDVTTTGGQIVLSASDLRRLGARIHSVLCVVERDAKSEDNLRREGLNLLALFRMNELELPAL
ncbi:MAG: orotate phosphoribosyltransferase [Chloroflexi bacterium RBG_16_57_8]|nr:MAG: orotate phosphoribosyltransferase [Chloroflexi bacterium RBG_16_57_8]